MESKVENLASRRMLSNGVGIPCVGFGTWQTPSGDVARDVVKKALEVGFRHIDTATAYGNEASVGEGIRLSGVKREDVFITTKQWTDIRGCAATIAAAEKAIQTLGVDYLDLYLVHWPAVAKLSADWAQMNADTWRGFEKLYKDGKVRAIGVSNFMPEHLEALKASAEVMPMVDQVEFGLHAEKRSRLLRGERHPGGGVESAWQRASARRPARDEDRCGTRQELGADMRALCDPARHSATSQIDPRRTHRGERAGI